jgi:phosphate transport system substrate-binding protein
MKQFKFSTLVAALTSALLAVSVSTGYATGQTVRVNGASSVQGFLDKCKAGYATNTGDTYTGYTAPGSGAGKTAIGNGTIDLGLSDSENKNADKPAGMLHIPFVAWPVTIMYNLNTNKQVNLSTDTIAKIFAGKITMWNDPQIIADNNKSYQQPVYKKGPDGKPLLDKKGAPIVLRYQTVRTYFTFPAKKIVVIYRIGNSGTSNNFTTALNKLAPTIWTKPGSDAFATAFPGDITSDPIGFQGGANAAALGQLASSTKYSITYNEYSFAGANNLAIANVINPAGNSISPASTEGLLASFSLATYKDGIVTFDYANKLASQYPFPATTYAMALPKYSSAALAGSVKDWITYHAFDCPSVATGTGFAVTSKTSELGKQILALVAKIGS